MARPDRRCEGPAEAAEADGAEGEVSAVLGVAVLVEGVGAEEEASVWVEGAVEAAAGGGDGWDASSSAVSERRLSLPMRDLAGLSELRGTAAQGIIWSGLLAGELAAMDVYPWHPWQ